MPSLVTARLLGSPQILIDGAEAPPELLWRKHLALCIVLWTAPERSRSRDQLIGLLWSDKSDAAARHSLNEALRVVRRAAGPETIESVGDYIRWSSPPELDIDHFARLEHTSPEAAAALVSGPFCDGFAVIHANEFESWIQSERGRWGARSVDVLVRAAAEAEGRGDARTAGGFAHRATELDPHSDVATQALVRAHWLAGNRTEALMAGERFRNRLAEELGRLPEEQTTALLDRLRRSRTPARPAGSANPERQLPLVGRDESLSQLLAGWRSVGAIPTPRLLSIIGAQGSGRSRLLEELTARAALEGATVATVRAVDADRLNPDAATLGLARHGLGAAPGIAGAPPAALATFLQRIPSWNDHLFAGQSSQQVPVRDAFEAIVHVLAAERPLMLAIDDADRLHPEEVHWLAVLLRGATGFDVTVVVTATVGAGGEAIDDLIRRTGRETPGVAIRLDPLSAEELRRLVDVVAESWHDDARDRLARRLVVESAGLPALAIDVLQAIHQGGSFEETAHWPEPDHTLDATLPGALPEPQAAALRVAFRRLGAEAQRILVAASLLDEPFTAEGAGAIAEIGVESVRDAALDALEWDGWIALDGRGYSFPARAKRRMVRNELMTPGLRRRLEEQILRHASPS